MIDFRTHVNRVLKHCTSTFGESVKVFPKRGGVFNIVAIFDNDFQVIDPNTEQVISANQSALGINLNDVSFDLSVGDQVEVRKIRFKIIDKKEDGQGGATLLLHKLKLNDRLGDTKDPEA